MKKTKKTKKHLQQQNRITRQLMRVLFVLSLMIVSCIQGQPQQSTNENILFSVERNDNSFVSYIDTTSTKVKLPTIVKTRIEREIAKLIPCKLEIIFQVRYNADIQLYVYKVRKASDFYYFVLVFNESKNILSRNIVKILGTNAENNEESFKLKLIKSPLLSLKDIDKDGEKEIIIRVRNHNGNIYNAVTAKYFKLSPKYEMINIFNIEEINKYPMNDCLIERRLDTDFSLYSYLLCNDTSEMLLGKVIINPFLGTISDKETFVDEYEGLLITGSGRDESSFLKGNIP